MSLNGDGQGTKPTAMSPGMHVQPGPMTLAVATHHGFQGAKTVVLHVEHAVGSNRFMLAPEMARTLAAMLLKEANGLQVARDLPPQL